MPNDEFQKERPQIQKEPSVSDALSETRLPLANDNSVGRPDQAGDLTPLIALCLGIFSLMLSGGWWIATNASESLRAASFSWGITTLIGPLNLVVGLITLIFGISGLNYSKEHPNLGGYRGSMFGIVMGVLAILFGLFMCFVWFILLQIGGFRPGNFVGLFMCFVWFILLQIGGLRPWNK
jgi:hypothetical protein